MRSGRLRFQLSSDLDLLMGGNMRFDGPFLLKRLKHARSYRAFEILSLSNMIILKALVRLDMILCGEMVADLLKGHVLGTSLWRIVKRMPKGALLHAHLHG